MLHSVGRMQHVGFKTLGFERSGSKIYPESLKNKCTPYLFAQKMARDRSTVKRCLSTLALLEMLKEEDDRVTKRGKTRYWIKQRGEKGYFNNIVRELMSFLPVVR